VAGNGTMGTNLLWSASISIKDGVTGATDQRISSFVPAPGALALVGLAGFASRRRRA
jgi:MYXO-CTERM domain-containing protein